MICSRFYEPTYFNTIPYHTISENKKVFFMVMSEKFYGNRNFRKSTFYGI